jgi:hypothetical protein
MNCLEADHTQAKEHQDFFPRYLPTAVSVVYCHSFTNALALLLGFHALRPSASAALHLPLLNTREHRQHLQFGEHEQSASTSARSKIHFHHWYEDADDCQQTGLSLILAMGQFALQSDRPCVQLQEYRVEFECQLRCPTPSYSVAVTNYAFRSLASQSIYQDGQEDNTISF